MAAFVAFGWSPFKNVFVEGYSVKYSLGVAVADGGMAFYSSLLGSPIKWSKLLPILGRVERAGLVASNFLKENGHYITAQGMINGVHMIFDWFAARFAY